MSNEFFNQFKAKRIEFMDNGTRVNVKDIATKKDEPLRAFTVSDFDFLTGENGEFVVFSLTEMPGNFFFGNPQITDIFKAIDAANMRDALKDEKVFFVKGISKKFNNEYVVMHVL